MKKLILFLMCLALLPGVLAFDKVAPIAYDCENNVLCYDVQGQVSCAYNGGHAIDDCAPVKSTIMKALEIGLVILVVVLVIVALIVIFTRKHKDDDEDDDTDGETYY